MKHKTNQTTLVFETEFPLFYKNCKQIDFF